MRNYRDKALETAAFIKARLPEAPRVGFLTGTGMGRCVDFLESPLSLDYAGIPHFPVSTAPGHGGRLIFGRAGNTPALAMSGRFHLYEGYDARTVSFPIRVMRALGIGHLLISNAAGGLNPDFAPGMIMIIDDHINLTGENPLIGPNEDDWGPRFPDMGRAWDRELANAAAAVAGDAGFAFCRGVYAGLKGPCLETPAEARLLRTIGADAVGFSTVMEAIAAVHAGMRILGLSIITNVHDPADPAPAILEDIIHAADQCAPRLREVVRGVIESIDAEAAHD